MAAFASTAIATASAAVKAVGGVSALTKAASLGISASSAVRQQQASDRAAEAEKEGRKVRTATETIKNRAARQRSARQERIRRANLLSSSVVSGSGGSSGQLGAQSALGSNFGAATARQSEQVLGANAISSANQRRADAVTDFQRIGGQGKLYNSVINFGNEANWFQ